MEIKKRKIFQDYDFSQNEIVNLAKVSNNKKSILISTPSLEGEEVDLNLSGEDKGNISLRVEKNSNGTHLIQDIDSLEIKAVNGNTDYSKVSVVRKKEGKNTSVNIESLEDVKISQGTVANILELKEGKTKVKTTEYRVEDNSVSPLSSFSLDKAIISLVSPSIELKDKVENPTRGIYLNEEQSYIVHNNKLLFELEDAGIKRSLDINKTNTILYQGTNSITLNRDNLEGILLKVLDNNHYLSLTSANTTLVNSIIYIKDSSGNNEISVGKDILKIDSKNVVNILSNTNTDIISPLITIKGKDGVNTPSIVIKDGDDSVSVEGNKVNITSKGEGNKTTLKGSLASVETDSTDILSQDITIGKSTTSTDINGNSLVVNAPTKIKDKKLEVVNGGDTLLQVKGDVGGADSTPHVVVQKGLETDTIKVTDNATIKKLTIEGDTSLKGELSVDKKISANQDLEVQGTHTIQGNLIVNNKGSNTSTDINSSDISIGSDNSNTSINGTSLTINSNTTVKGKDFTVNGDGGKKVTLKGTPLTSSEKELTVIGGTKTDTLDVTGNSNLKDVTLEGTHHIKGNLKVEDTSTNKSTQILSKDVVIGQTTSDIDIEGRNNLLIKSKESDTKDSSLVKANNLCFTDTVYSNDIKIYWDSVTKSLVFAKV